ncbi:uncharacterized protein LOC111868792 isoform X1 [Cryptotermes secundus]|uniref:uncharacterized protein LOC111868792 isoform X1 n=1 Tax=Cryptotermes secundus TaxID=105785 RepID=UPI000CD7D6C4|nr:uncharacterized protein LOC111868792 isoform X1 [Cryptotermes secundus]
MVSLITTLARRSRYVQQNLTTSLVMGAEVRNANSKSGAMSVHLVPESRYCDVLNHITPIFLRDEPLSQCFPPCTTGQRERDFREYADMQLRSGLCVMALEGSSVVGACLNRPLTRDQVMGCSLPSSVGPAEDPLIANVVRMLITVHRQLDLFEALGVDTIFEVGLVSVEPTHTGRGLAVQLIRASLEAAAQRGFRAAKADCTSSTSARICERAGMATVHKLLYDEYKLDNKVVFKDTATRGPALTVMAAALQDTEPYVLPFQIKSKV